MKKMDLNSWLNVARFFVVGGASFALIGGSMVWYLTNQIGKNNRHQIETLESKNIELQEKVKPENIEKQYENIKKEKVLEGLTVNPDINSNGDNLPTLVKANLSDDDYEIVKDAFLKVKKFNKIGESPLWGFQILLFRKFPHKIYEDEKVWRKFETGNDSGEMYHLSYGYSNSEIIIANKYFIEHCLKFGGIKKNKNRINNYLLKDENVLLDLNGEFGEIKLYENILSTIKDTDNRIALFETVSSAIFKIHFGKLILKNESTEIENIDILDLETIKKEISKLKNK